MIATHVNHLDALGQPVVIGNRYGYSVSSNGSTTVVTGKLVSTAKESVRIQPDTETNYYGNRRSDRPTDKNPRNVRSCILFPTPTYALARGRSPSANRTSGERLESRRWNIASAVAWSMSVVDQRGDLKKAAMILCSSTRNCSDIERSPKGFNR